MTSTEQRTTAPSPGAGQAPVEDLPRMSLGDHIDELRRRLLRSVVAVVVALLVVVPFKDSITHVYTAPYETVWMARYEAFLVDLDAEAAAAKAEGRALDELEQQKLEFHRKYRAAILDGSFPPKHYPTIANQGGFALSRTLKALGGIEDMWVYMSATILFALAIAAPVVVWQIWAFIAAGLYTHERRVVMRSLPWAFVLLGGGIAFGYFVAVPLALYMLIQFMDQSRVEPLFSVQNYFGLLLLTTVALGLVFQLPLLMVEIHRVGVLSHAQMKKYWRHVIVGMFVISAILTPPDVVTQCLMAVPLTVLYLVGLILTWFAERRRAAGSTEPMA